MTTRVPSKAVNTLLIDADVFCYQFAFRNESQVDWGDDDDPMVITSPEVAREEVLQFVDDLKEKLKGGDVYFILSDRHANFRKELEPTYKSNRKAPKPELWSFLRDFIEEGDHGYPVRSLGRLEGDDVLGMMATHPKRGRKSIMVSIDKDMQTVPGRLYLYNKPKLGVLHTDLHQARMFHMTQTLTGDAVDGYRGCPGIGPVKAREALAGLRGYALWEAVVEVYESKGLAEEDALLQARLAYILQYGDYKGGKIKLWKPSRLRKG